MIKNIFAGVGALSIVGSSLLIAAEPIAIDPIIQQRLEKIDPMMNKVIEISRIPGMSVGVVVDGKVVFSKGYGVRNFSETSPVTDNSLFAIGSCSKAFTTFAIGQLVDEGMIAWDDPVIKYIPEFRLHDIHATHHLTIKDLVTHRSGLPRHDFVWYNSKFSRSELLNRLQHLEPTSDIREKFQYNNLMYAVAGLVIERLTGQTWEEFIQNRIFDPIGMNLSNFSVDDSQQSNDYASPHSERNEKTEIIPFRNLSNIGPAGSINSSAADMVKWVQLQLSEGNVEGKHLINKATLQEMHIVQMPMPPLPSEETPYMFGYGLGWMTGLHKGHYTVAHGGGIDGFISSVVLFPKEKIGVVVLTNSDSHGLFPQSAAYGIADLLMGVEDDQWLSQAEEKEKQMKALLKKAENENAPTEIVAVRPFENYVGEFENPGYGTVKVSLDQDALMASHNEISYALKHKCYDHFTVSAKLVETQKFNCSFISNASGEISELQIAIEPLLPPIVFKRKTATELLATDYLKKFAGVFECPVFSMDIALKKGRLTATVPGQPSCELKPEKPNVFSLKELPDCILQFIVGMDGAVSELQLQQAGQTFSLKAKAAD